MVAAGEGEAAAEVFQVAAGFLELGLRDGQGSLGGPLPLLQLSDADLGEVCGLLVVGWGCGAWRQRGK